MGRVVREDDTSFEEVYVELYVRARRVAARILANEAEADDIAAETMVRAMSVWRRVKAYSAPWVTRVAANLAIDVLRRRQRERPASPEPVTDDPTDRIVLADALRKLSARQREAVVLRYLVGLTGRETAEAMGLSEKTLKTHLRRGVDALRRDLGRDLSELTHAA